MPEFILETDGVVEHVMLSGCVETGLTLEFADLDEFTQGYIEALFFTENAPGVDRYEFETADYQARMVEGRTDGNIPDDTGFSDLGPEFLESIIADCLAFQLVAAPLLTAAYGREFPARIIGDGTLPDSHRTAWDYDAAAAGRDFWYTRNGHGVGFWDRGLGDVGDRLSELCGWRTGFGEIYVWWNPDSARVSRD